MKTFIRILAAFTASFSIAAASAATAGYPLDNFPTEKLTQQPALQNGARLFVNYCLGCHSASLMRYNRLNDIGLNDEQVRANLVFDPNGKVGDLMKVAMRPVEAKEWFGAIPPDLSVTARARASEVGSGSDWIYTYLRSYFPDATRPSGWNNTVFEAVGMPHALWELQGVRTAKLEEIRESAEEGGNGAGFVKSVVTFDANGVRTEQVEKLSGHGHHPSRNWTLSAPAGGTMTTAQFDDNVADLVAYMTYMSDPTARTRTRLGVWVLLFLGVFTIFAWMLNREYWKDIK